MIDRSLYLGFDPSAKGKRFFPPDSSVPIVETVESHQVVVTYGTDLRYPLSFGRKTVEAISMQD
tara:strand:+ start:263 stop:454 length:192 start_codon:yes stop_codon:yes gene_type:complete